LVKEASSFLFRQDNKRFLDIVETYRWVTATKSASQTSCFEAYSRNYATGDVDATALDDRQELKLVLEVTDIIDELKMIRHLAEKQREVLKALVTALIKLHPADAQADGLSGSPPVTINECGFHNNGPGHQFITFTTQAAEGIRADAQDIKILAQGIQEPARETLISTDETLVLLIMELDIVRKDAEYAHKTVRTTGLTQRMSRLTLP
jgi:hypothetical protein